MLFGLTLGSVAAYWLCSQRVDILREQIALLERSGSPEITERLRMKVEKLELEVVKLQKKLAEAEQAAKTAQHYRVDERDGLDQNPLEQKAKPSKGHAKAFFVRTRPGSTLPCETLSFREIELSEFQYWTNPELGRGFWASQPLAALRSIEFGDFGEDADRNTYVVATLEYFDGRKELVYTLSNYHFKCGNPTLPTGDSKVPVSTISRIEL